MNEEATAVLELDEPMGIVISRGTEAETTPMVLAYIWAPDPEDTDEPVHAKA